MNREEVAKLAPGSVVIADNGGLFFRINSIDQTGVVDTEGFSRSLDEFPPGTVFATVYVARRTYRAHAPGHYDLIPPDVKMVDDKDGLQWVYDENTDTWGKARSIGVRFSAYRMLEMYGPVTEVEYDE